MRTRATAFTAATASSLLLLTACVSTPGTSDKTNQSPPTPGTTVNQPTRSAVQRTHATRATPTQRTTKARTTSGITYVKSITTVLPQPPVPPLPKHPTAGGYVTISGGFKGTVHIPANQVHCSIERTSAYTDEGTWHINGSVDRHDGYAADPGDLYVDVRLESGYKNGPRAGVARYRPSVSGEFHTQTTAYSFDADWLLNEDLIPAGPHAALSTDRRTVTFTAATYTAPVIFGLPDPHITNITIQGKITCPHPMRDFTNR